MAYLCKNAMVVFPVFFLLNIIVSMSIFFSNIKKNIQSRFDYLILIFSTSVTKTNNDKISHKIKLHCFYAHISSTLKLCYHQINSFYSNITNPSPLDKWREWVGLELRKI